MSARPLASPVPVTFAGLATASVLVSGVELGWFAGTGKHAVGLLIFAAVVPLQAVATVWGVAAADTPTTASSAVLGGTWAATAATFLSAPATPGLPATLGVLQLMAAGLLVISAVAEHAGGTELSAAIVGLAALRFAVSGLSGVTGSETVGDVSGVAGLVVSAAALGAIAALELGAARQAP